MVSDLLRREGVKPAKRLPYLKPVASDTTGRRHEGADFRGDDDAPTVQLSVAELLRRESDEPEHTRSGKRTTITIAAGVAALFGLAAVAFGAIGSHDTGLTAADGQGDRTTGPSPSTATVANQPDLLTSGSGLALGATPVTDTASSGPVAQQGKVDKTTRAAAPVNAQSNGMAGRGGQSNGTPVAGSTTSDTATVTDTPSSPATTPSTSTPEPSTPTTTTPTTGHSGTNSQTPTTTPTTTTSNTDLLGSVTGLADGVITGLLGH